MKLAFALAASLTALVADARAECAMMELVPQLLTPANTTLPVDGGVLVGTLARTPVDYQHASRVEDPALTNTWKYQSAGKPVAVDKVVLAPGLVMYRPKTGTAIDVLDQKNQKLGAFKRTTTTTSPASVVAPRVTKLETTTVGRRRGDDRRSTATVADPIPTDAFAIIVYGPDKKPISYALVGRLDPKQRTVIAYTDPPSCAWNAKGADVPPTGKQVTLAWADAFGRVSKQSAPITVTALPKQDQDHDP